MYSKVIYLYSLERLVLKLKFQHFGHLMQRAESDSLEKILMLGKIEGGKRSGWQRLRWLDGITDSVDMSLRKLWETVKDREVWRVAVHGVTKSQSWLSNWATNPYMYVCMRTRVCVFQMVFHYRLLQDIGHSSPLYSKSLLLVYFML